MLSRTVPRKLRHLVVESMKYYLALNKKNQLRKRSGEKKGFILKTLEKNVKSTTEVKCLNHCMWGRNMLLNYHLFIQNKVKIKFM